MTNTTSNIAASLQTVKDSVVAMAEKHGRNPLDIKLLAVSKTKPVELIGAAISAGQHAFGENYPDEAVEKIGQLADSPCEWHFIGAIQSRKSAAITQHFSWVHSIDRLKVAKKLAEHRPPGLPALQCCLQINVDGEDSKAGIAPDQLHELAAACAQFPQLKLRGLMAIPKPRTEFDEQREAFAKVRTLLEALKQTYPDMDTLSMGMSGDMEAAIAEGATIIRVGTAIFGSRNVR